MIDALLRSELPYGPAGAATTATATASTRTAAFDGTGIGRPWPLLAGERAHYELAAGRRAEARAPAGGDRGWRKPRRAAARAGLGRRRRSPRWSSIPASRAARRCRWSGRMPSTSSCCARWPTARCSTGRRRRCAATCARKRVARCRAVAAGLAPPSIPVGRVLRLDLPEAALVHWSTDGWQTKVT